MAILKNTPASTAARLARLAVMNEAVATPTPPPAGTEEITSAAAAAVAAVDNVDDLDALLLGTEQKEAYGPDLVEAMAKLVKYTANEGISLNDIRSAFNRVNDILLANPSLATEVMLDAHIGELCKAAYRLSNMSVSVGSKRKAASKDSKTTRVKKETADAQKSAARIEAMLSKQHAHVVQRVSSQDDEVDV